MLERHRRVAAMIPLLYFAIGINAFASSLAAQGDFPLLYQLILPSALIGFAIIRLVQWRRRGHQPVTPEKAARHLRRTFVLAVVLSLAGGLWALGAFLDVHETRRALAAFFILIGGIAAATCLAPLPRAAPVSLALSLTPVGVAMLASGDLGLQAIALSIGLLALLVIHQSADHARDMEHNFRLLDRLERQASSDTLTGLANRRGFAAAFEEARQAATHGSRFSLLMIDLDGFKAANDRFGHIAGDGVLIETARRLEGLFPDARIIARFGGDEFVLLSVETHPRGDWAERIAAAEEALSLPVVDPVQTIPIGASIGFAEADADEAALDPLLIVADTALYRHKESRRSAVRRRA